MGIRPIEGRNFYLVQALGTHSVQNTNLLTLHSKRPRESIIFRTVDVCYNWPHQVTDVTAVNNSIAMETEGKKCFKNKTEYYAGFSSL